MDIGRNYGVLIEIMEVFPKITWRVRELVFNIINVGLVVKFRNTLAFNS